MRRIGNLKYLAGLKLVDGNVVVEETVWKQIVEENTQFIEENARYRQENTDLRKAAREFTHAIRATNELFALTICNTDYTPEDFRKHRDDLRQGED